MSVSVEKTRAAVGLKAIEHCLLIDVEDLLGFICHTLLALSARLLRKLRSFLKASGKKFRLSLNGTHHLSKVLIFQIIGTQAVPVQKYDIAMCCT